MARALGGAAPPARIGVALSGGGDSVALAALMSTWAEQHGTAVLAATVDHRLRPGSAAEAAEAGAIARRLGIGHDLLVWVHDGVAGNLQDAARRARYGLLADWARQRGLGAVALGHTANDQAETVLMRLARGAGVDGLSGMDWCRRDGEVVWLRPMLGIGRAALRAWLRARDIAWVEDPSNEDPAFERVRARRVLAGLSDIGLTAMGLARTADRLRDAREALSVAARRAAARWGRLDGTGAIVLGAGLFREEPREIARRIVATAVQWLAGAEYPPRHGPVAEILEGRDVTVLGCQAKWWREALWLFREVEALGAVRARPGAAWDGRWRLLPPAGEDGAGCIVRALGEPGLRCVRRMKDAAPPRVPAAALAATPAVFCGTEPVAAPLAGWPNGWQVVAEKDFDDFLGALVSH